MRALAWLALATIGLTWACTSGRDPAPPDTDQLATGSFDATLDGVDIHFEVHGQGPPLMVLTNSWGFDSAGVRALFRPLEERLSLVYFDPRGMGRSGPVREPTDMGLEAVRSDLDALRRHLGLEQVDVIGWSNGAMNLIYFAAEHPDTVRRAVFVHGAASFGPEDMESFAARNPELMLRYADFLERVQDPGLDEPHRTAMLRELWLGEWFPLSTADPANAHSWMGELFRDAQFSFAHADYTDRAHPVFDARDRLGAITARCLVVAGRHDMMPVEKVSELHQGLGDSQLVVFEDSGHFAPVEEREEFVRTVWEFLGVGDR